MFRALFGRCNIDIAIFKNCNKDQLEATFRVQHCNTSGPPEWWITSRWCWSKHCQQFWVGAEYFFEVAPCEPMALENWCCILGPPKHPKIKNIAKLGNCNIDQNILPNIAILQSAKQGRQTVRPSPGPVWPYFGLTLAWLWSNLNCSMTIDRFGWFAFGTSITLNYNTSIFDLL
jgi:hypothetical protein